jgi:hypothetical protein
MPHPPSRRAMFKLGALALVAKAPAHLFGAAVIGECVPTMISDHFPSQAPDLVREMVTVSHFNLNRVKELVTSRPALVTAAWDWGFGDWETPLGAASHMGNRPIAEFLIAHGAPTTLFSAAMVGQLDVIKALVAAQPAIQRIHGPHSISLLAHARMGGDAARPVFDYLHLLGNADSETPIPLTPADSARLAGTYVFDNSDANHIEVNADMKMAGRMYTWPPQLNWTRKGTMTRPLFHLGDLVFYPAGAPSVRVRFTVTDNKVAMAVTDGDFTLSAVRLGSG